MSLGSVEPSDVLETPSSLLDSTNQNARTLDSLLETIKHLPKLNLVDPIKIWPLISVSLRDTPETSIKVAAMELMGLLLEYANDSKLKFRLLVYSALRSDGLLQDDLFYTVRVLEILTNGGRNLVGVERDLVAFLCILLEAPHGGKPELLSLISRVLKFNFSNLNSMEIGFLLNRLFQLKMISPSDTVLDESQVEVLDSLVRYGFVHEACLSGYLRLTCQLLEGPLPKERVWDVVHNLFRSHCAYQSLTILCGFVEKDASDSAMFLLMTSLWGSSRVSTLSFPTSAIIDSIRVASSSAGTSALKLLGTLLEWDGVELGSLEWEMALDVISVAGYNSKVITLMFDAYTRREFTGDANRFMSLLRDFFPQLTTEQSIGLLDYLDGSNLFVPLNPDWQDSVDRVVGRLCSKEPVKFRARLLEILVRSFSEANEFYLEDLIERIVKPLLACLPEEQDTDLFFSIAVLALDAISLLSPASRFALASHLVSSLSLDTSGGYVTSTRLERRLDSCVAVLIGSSFLWSVDESPFNLKLLQLLLQLTSFSTCARAKLIAFNLLSRLRADLAYIFVLHPRQSVATVRTILREIIFDESTLSEQKDSASPDRLQDLTVASLPTEGRTSIRNDDFPSQAYLLAVTNCLELESSWQVVSNLLKEMPIQLANLPLFWDAKDEVNELRHHLFVWISRATFLKQVHSVPENFRRGDLYVLAYRLLGPLLGFRAFFNKQERDEVVLAYQMGLHKWPTTARVCIHALTICCFELQMSMTKLLPSTLVKLSQIMSAATISAHILEFLSCLACLPSLYGNFVDADFKRVFGIALQYIQHQTRTGEQAHLQYVLVLAYHVISVWFVNLRIKDRRKLIPFIYRGLQLASQDGSDEQTDACLDMLARYAFSTHHSRFSTDPMLQSLMKGGTTQTWLRGDMLVSVQTAPPLTWMLVTIRRPSGTINWITETCVSESIPQTLVSTWGVEEQNCLNLAAGLDDASQPLPLPPESSTKEAVRSMLEYRGVRSSYSTAAELGITSKEEMAFDPGFLHLGLGARSVIPPFLPIPTDEATNRAISVLDRMPIVDFHKIGVIYVGHHQSNELEILRNRAGSPGYIKFINGLGRLVRLQGCRDVYTGGLDTEMDLDGSHTWAWGDGLSQVIFHVATMMPTNPATDPQCAGKKRHIGNDYVSIVYNDSGRPYRFNALPGQFNLVNLIVSPIPCSGDQEPFYLVQAQVRQDLPELSPLLEPKLVSADKVSGLMRQLSLHAAVFAQVFLRTGSYATNWTERLRQIRRIQSRLST